MFHVYIADAVWGIAHGRAFDKRFVEITNPPPPEARTPEEVKASMLKKLKEV